MASLFSGGWEGGCGKEKEVILTMMNHECPGSPAASIQGGSRYAGRGRGVLVFVYRDIITEGGCEIGMR